MLNIETLQNIVELIGSLSFITIIYFSLNYLMNAHIEDKKLKLYGYNIKSINITLIVMLFDFILIPPLVFYYFNFISDNKDLLNGLTTTYFIFLLILIGVAFICYFKKQINFLFIILTSILSILSGYLSYYLFNKYGIGICFNIILLYLLIFILLIAFYSPLIKKYTPYKYTQEIIFQKELPEDKTNGTIIFETSDEIVIEIGSELHRYKKSDIFCIKNI